MSRTWLACAISVVFLAFVASFAVAGAAAPASVSVDLGVRFPAPDSSCCLPDGSCRLIASRQACEGAGGLFFGLSPTCDPNPCAAQPGACCLLNGTCMVLSPEACQSHPEGGWFVGYMRCEDGLCADPAVEVVTWGRIKAVYR